MSDSNMKMIKRKISDRMYHLTFFTEAEWRGHRGRFQENDGINVDSIEAGKMMVIGAAGTLFEVYIANDKKIIIELL